MTKKSNPIDQIMKLIKISIFCLIVYVGYKASTDFKNFTKNPLDNLFNIKTVTQIDTKILHEKLLKESQYIFAVEDMKLQYKFYRKKGLAWIEATFEWEAETNIGITKNDFTIKQVDNEIVFKINNIKVFKPNNSSLKTTHKDKSTWPIDWRDDSTPHRAFEQDMEHVTFEKLKPILQQNINKVHNYAKSSIADFLQPIINEIDDDIKIKVVIDEKCNYKYTPPSGHISGYYKDQKKEMLSNSLSKKNYY